MTLTRAELARRLDYHVVRPDATAEDVRRFCAEARAAGIHSVCVQGSRVELAAALLEESEVKVTCLVGFPLGAGDSDVKRYEAEAAIDQGAQEVEFVLNVGRLKEGDHRYVLREMRDLAEAAEERHVKVVLETALLTAEEVRAACLMALDSGVHFVCTGTGLPGPATLEDVRLLRESVGAKFGVKASGGVTDAAVAAALMEAGASLLGVMDLAALKPA